MVKDYYLSGCGCLSQTGSHDFGGRASRKEIIYLVKFDKQSDTFYRSSRFFFDDKERFSDLFATSQRGGSFNIYQKGRRVATVDSRRSVIALMHKMLTGEPIKRCSVPSFNS